MSWFSGKAMEGAVTRRVSYWSSAQDSRPAPPGEGIEEVIEAGTRRGLRLIQRAAERLGGEQAGGIARLGGTDQAAPGRGRHLVGGVAPEALDPEPLEPGDVSIPIGHELVAGVVRVEVELGEVAPHGALRRVVGIDRERALDLAVLVAPVEVRARLSEVRLPRGVVDHEVGHDLEAVAGGLLDEAAQLRVVVFARGIAEARVEAGRVLDGVEAARAAGLVEGVEVDPVEAHRGDARQLGPPGRDRSDEEREQVVDPGARGRDAGADGLARGRADALLQVHEQSPSQVSPRTGPPRFCALTGLVQRGRRRVRRP
jgi:hypothetical protein